MRILFMGTPDFALSSLEALFDYGHEIVGVFTQPDKTSGRGLNVTYSPVKQFAMNHGISVYQPEKLRDGTAYEIVCSLNPDLIVVVAYGKIIPDDIIAFPEKGIINVHGSLLPKYRGAAPIQWSVLNGDIETGVTTMYLAHDMDAGDIIYTQKTAIHDYETSGELYDRLKVIGADLLIKTVDDIMSGTAPRAKQNDEEATYVTMLDKSMSPIDWNNSSEHIIRQIYGLQPWPVAASEIGGAVLKIFGCKRTDNNTSFAPGSIIYAGNEGIEISCGDGKTILITEVQAPGKKKMPASDYVRGHKLETVI